MNVISDIFVPVADILLISYVTNSAINFTTNNNNNLTAIIILQLMGTIIKCKLTTLIVSSGVGLLVGGYGEGNLF